MITPLVTAPYLAATALLGGAGAAKAIRPEDTANALRAAGLAVPRQLVRAGAGVEVCIALAALASPGPLTGTLVALSYLGFAVFVALALRNRWPISACGCFGRADTPPTRAHLGLDLAAATCAAWWAAVAPSGLILAFAHQPWGGVPLGLVTGALAYLAFLVFNNPLIAARRAASGSAARPLVGSAAEVRP